jgi:hypothetical protein
MSPTTLMTTPIKCPKCGIENRPDARFCKRCGQPLQKQTSAPPPSTVCPACGATVKPGAHFCPRCGKPLPTEPAPPAHFPAPTSPPADSTQPTTPAATLPYTPHPSSPTTPPQPSSYAQPPVQPPPPVTPSAPKRSFPRWAGWAMSVFALICIVALGATAIALGPKIFGSEPTATPVPLMTPSPTEAPPTTTPTLEPPTPTPTTTALPAFDAQVSITASSTELQIGDALTVTVTISNTGQVPFGSLRYQLVGEWEPPLRAPTGAAIGHELDVPPGESDTATFILEAMAPGTAQIHANVTVEPREEPSTIRPISSAYVIEVSVVQ